MASALPPVIFSEYACVVGGALRRPSLRCDGCSAARVISEKGLNRIMHSRLSRFAPRGAALSLAFSGIVAMLAGCSGGSQIAANPPDAGGTADLSKFLHADSSIGGESLTGTSYTYQCNADRQRGPFHWLVHFTANGKATGPFPGRFTASGKYRFVTPPSSGNILLHFYERFTIKSHTRTLTGNINLVRVGSDVRCDFIQSQGGNGFILSYTISDDKEHNWSGSATASIDAPDFQESLQ